MSRLGTILMAVALVSALLAVPLGVSAVAAQEPNTSVAPGERLAGVVGIQEAAVAGDLSERSYAARLDRADTDAERAAIVAERREEIERRLTAHQTELADLRAAREAGNITEGTYRARVATLAAEKGSTERAAERASETARRLPEDVREARGISVESFRELRANASELGGPETAAIAREIGGPNASRPTVGPPGSESDNGGPAAPTPNRSATGRPMPASDERPAESGERQVGERPTNSGERPVDDTRPTGTTGGDSTASPSDPNTQHGASDDTTRQNGDTPSGSPDSADRQDGSATGTDNPASNSR